jgi:AraC-like DNA-binding protein
MLNSTTAGIGRALESGATAETILAQSGVRAISAGAASGQSGFLRLARLLADAQAEFDHLHSVTRRAGYQIIFRDPSGSIIDHLGNEQNGAPKSQTRGGLAPNVLHRIRDYVEANLEFKVELADLAAIANLSRCHFTYAFKQALGCTPHRYVMSRRLEKARQLLLGSGLATAEIAIAAGFADQSHFSRYFRSFFGVSPVAYRRSRSGMMPSACNPGVDHGNRRAASR